MYAVKKPCCFKVLAEATMQMNSLDTSEIHKLKLSFFEFSFFKVTLKKNIPAEYCYKKKRAQFFKTKRQRLLK